MPGSLFDGPQATALRALWQRRDEEELLAARAQQAQRLRTREENPPTILNTRTGRKINIIGKSWAQDLLSSITTQGENQRLLIAPQDFRDAIQGLKQAKIRWWQFMDFFERFHDAYDSKNIWDQMAVYDILAVTQQCSIQEAVCLTVLDKKRMRGLN